VTGCSPHWIGQIVRRCTRDGPDVLRERATGAGRAGGALASANGSLSASGNGKD